MNVKEYTVYIVDIILYCICRIYYPYIVKSVYGDIVISVQYICIYVYTQCTYIVSTSLYTVHCIHF